MIPLAMSARVGAPGPAFPFEPSFADAGEPASQGDGLLDELLAAAVVATAAEGGMILWTAAEREPVLLAECGDGDNPADLRPGSGRVFPAFAFDPDRTGDTWRALPSRCGGAWLHGTSLRLPGGVVTIALVHRRWSSDAERRANDAVRRFHPFLFPSLRLWAARGDVSARLRRLTAAVDRTDLIVMIADRDSRLLFASSSAETLLGAENGLRRRGDRLAAVSLGDTLRLQAAVAHVTAGGSEESDAVPVIAIAREGRRKLLTAVARAEAAGGGDGEAVIYAIDPDKDRGGSLEPVCKLYGLSPVETKLACLLADGRSLADAAIGMRVQEQTARSYLKQVFLKTDTRRQAELVWLMLKSTVRTTTGLKPTFL